MTKPETTMMMIRFRIHQGIKKGETIQETIDGRMYHYKVINIQSVRTLDDGRQEVHMDVQKLPGGDPIRKNKHGWVILNYCEICAGIGIKKELTEHEKETYGNECQECQDHLSRMLGVKPNERN